MISPVKRVLIPLFLFVFFYFLIQHFAFCRSLPAGINEPATKAWLVDRCFLGFLYERNEGAAFRQSDKAGPGEIDVDGSLVIGRRERSGVTLDQALSALGRWQKNELFLCAKEWIGVDIEALNLRNGFGSVWQEAMWNEAYPNPDRRPNTNEALTLFVDDNGGTCYFAWGCTGAYGVFWNQDPSPEFPGGTGQQIFIYRAPNGDTSFVHLTMDWVHYSFGEYHLEASIPIDPYVEITGPDEIDEDTRYSWTAKLDENCLPEDSMSAWDFEWDGPARYRWSAPEGIPTSGTGDTFETKYLEPGEFEWKVEIERDYTYKRHVPVRNPFWDISQPIHRAFRPGVGSVDGTVRTTVTRRGPLHDITPPDLDFVIKTEEGINRVSIIEDPEDKEPPKTYTVSVTGVNFLPEIGESLDVTVSDVPSASPVRLDASLSPSLSGFFEKEDRRFFIVAQTVDNYSPRDALHPRWTIVDNTTGDILLPVGDVSHAILRYNNEETMDEFLLTAVVADEAGNTTTLQIPFTVFKVTMGVTSLKFNDRTKR